MTAATLPKRPLRITLKDVMREMTSMGTTLNKRMDEHDEMFRVVINHMSQMEQRLTARLDKHDAMFVIQGKKIDANTAALLDVEERLTTRINALEEDLTATMVDTIKIRTFVGMPLPEED